MTLKIVAFFVLLLLYTFNTIVITSLIYLLMIPISSMHFMKIRNKFKTQLSENEDHEDIL